VFRCYEQNIGALTPVIADRLGMAIDDFGVDWVVSAVEYATGQEKRSLAYVEGVLRGWKRDGLTTVPKDGAKPLVSTEDVIRSVASAAS
jgi:DnaD/phage-associated family protein